MRGTMHAPGSVQEWIEFVDPGSELDMYRVNVTLMLSNYRCIFGKGCPGLLNLPPSSVRGCCERGVRFNGDDDFNNVSMRVTQLTEEDMDPDRLKHVREQGWYLKSPKSGRPYKTRKLGDRCIFANSDANGKPGCAFHHLANRLGVHHSETKPDICWQVPIRVDDLEVDTTKYGVVTHVVTAYDADDWGGEEDLEREDGTLDAGHMGWWCMDTPDAFVGQQPFYVTNEVELRKMMSDTAYDEMVRLLKEYGPRKFKVPGEARNGGRPMLPVIIEQRQRAFNTNTDTD